MLVNKRHWDMFIKDNRLDEIPIRPCPLTGRISSPNDPDSNLFIQLNPDENGVLIHGEPSIGIDKDFVELPDNWFMPLTKKSLPLKTNDKIYMYGLTTEKCAVTPEILKQAEFVYEVFLGQLQMANDELAKAQKKYDFQLKLYESQGAIVKALKAELQ